MVPSKKFWQNKVVIITGSSRGIGKKTAEQLMALGASVVLNGRTQESLDRCIKELEKLFSLSPEDSQKRLLPVVADVSTQTGAIYLVTRALSRFNRIDVLINNAGMSMRGNISEISSEVVRNIFVSNFESAFFMSQAATQALLNAKGRVLFVSSLAGVRGFPGVSVYSAAKSALEIFRQSFAAENPGIKTGLIYLAFTENDQDKTIYAPDGNLIHHQRKWQMTQQQAANCILASVEKGKKISVLTLKGKLLHFFNAHFPFLVELLLQRSKGQIHAIKKS